MAFEPIETQEALDKIIKERVERERAKYADYDELKKKIASHNSDIDNLKKQAEKDASELKAKIKVYEMKEMRLKAAKDAGLSYDLADRIAGDDEESMKKDAEALKKLIGHKHTPPRETEAVKEDYYMDMVKQMKGE